MCSTPKVPDPIPPAPPAPPPPEAATLSIDNGVKKKSEGALATGRSALRIDRTSSNLGGGAGGLNIPQ